MQITGEAPHGKCFVDGELTGDIRDVVLRDRRHISEGGLVVAFVVIDGGSSDVVLGPDIMCKGDIGQTANEAPNVCLDKELNIQGLQNRLRETLGMRLKARLGKKPMIIPIIMEI